MGEGAALHRGGRLCDQLLDGCARLDLTTIEADASTAALKGSTEDEQFFEKSTAEPSDAAERANQGGPQAALISSPEATASGFDLRPRSAQPPDITTAAMRRIKEAEVAVL